MTALLEKALARAASLPAEQQDFVASIILEELDGNERWEALLADPRSQSAIDQLAAEGIAEFDAGRTVPGGFGDK